MKAILMTLLLSPPAWAAEPCREVTGDEMPKELKLVCGREHPYAMNKAVWISKNRIAIECVFASFIPKYS